MKSKRLGAIFIAACFACSPLASAEVKTYEGTGEYVMSDFETPDIAKQRAKARAEQNCVEQAGVYVKSYTRTVNSVVTEDEVEAIANTIISVVNEKYVVTPISESGGSFRIVATIRATVDSERIDSWMARDYVRNKEMVEENKRLNEEKVKQDAEIAELRNKLIVVKNNQEKKRLEAEVVNADRKFLANQKAKQGWRLFFDRKYVDAMTIFSEAIGINDMSAIAYEGRASTYFMQHNYQRAIADFNSAIEIDNKNERAIILRGIAYVMQEDYQLAMKDFTKAIELNPNDAEAYCQRGRVYYINNNSAQAIIEYNKAIAIDPKLDEAYYYRGRSYSQQGEYKQAIDNYNKTIGFNLRYAKDSYYYRGEAYLKLGRYYEAIADFNKAIAYNPKDAFAYAGRGLCYDKLGNKKQAYADFVFAKKLYSGK